jgi:hypothetical protein
VSITIEHNDILTWCKEYTGPKAHAALMDPPYHLTSITERFGGETSAPAKFGRDGAFQRASKGFMGTTWDGGTLAFQPATWAALAEHLYPGAFIFAFAGCRGYHRMACAMEDANLIIHPACGWIFSTGFPKATRIDQAVDRAAGVEREIIGDGPYSYKKPNGSAGVSSVGLSHNPGHTLTAPATPLARAWAGHRYGLQSLKPSFEFIAVAQVPYRGRPVDCITSTGAGALNIDQARIGTGNTMRDNRVASSYLTQSIGNPQMSDEEYTTGSPLGRWPSNLCLSHDFDCTADVCAESCAVRMVGEQSGDLQSGSKHGLYKKNSNGIYGEFAAVECHHDGDSGTAARFYFNADYMYERLEQSDPVNYCAKSSTAEREAGLDDFASTTVDDGRHKRIDNAYQRGETERRNTHPCCKPISLNKWLASLLLPPDMYAPRRLLIPFSGSGSEMVGALLAGWEHITGIEREQAYAEIARARLAWWQRQQQRLQTSDPETILEQARVLRSEQLGLFE